VKSRSLFQCLATGLLLSFVASVSGQSNGQPTYLDSSMAIAPQSRLHTTVEDDHRIVINSDGVSQEVPEYPEQLRTMFDHIAKQSAKRLLVFIHGGLTSLTDANKTAKNLGRKIECSDPNTYAIFVNWDSGLVRGQDTSSGQVNPLCLEESPSVSQTFPGCWPPPPTLVGCPCC
jgi:hypothetical protein